MPALHPRSKDSEGSNRDASLRLLGVLSLLTFPAAGILFIAGLISAAAYFAISLTAFVLLLVSLVPTDAWARAFTTNKRRT